jgi:hypothetical protein
MAKKQAKAKVQHPRRELSPSFDPGREFGSAASIGGTVISDAGGRLWVVDSQNREGRPVKFFDK